MKTVPKYITAIVVKDIMEDILPPVDKTDRQATIIRSATKSVTAAVAGAALTNPFDVLRNEYINYISYLFLLKPFIFIIVFIIIVILTIIIIYLECLKLIYQLLILFVN